MTKSNIRPIPIVWATHPRHLPPPPEGRVVVVDLAFAAGKSVKKTKKFIDAIGHRLVAYVDHHEHPLWDDYQDDERFVLVKNAIAHACPELVTPERIHSLEGGVASDAIVAHADFDGMVAAIKWRASGALPWPEADEDARAVDSPGRGHTLSKYGARYAHAIEEATTFPDRKDYTAFLTKIADAISFGEDASMTKEIDEMAESAERIAKEAHAFALANGSEESEGVFVVRLDERVDNRVRKHYLMAGETQCPIGALYEPDPAGGAWVTAATFNSAIDLAMVDGFEGGRSDYRFARAVEKGAENIQKLSDYLKTLELS